MRAATIAAMLAAPPACLDAASRPAVEVPAKRAHPPAAALAVLALVGLVPGCSSSPPATEEAARAVLASEAFRAARVETLDTEFAGPCSEALAAQPDWNRWAGLGLVRTAGVVTAGGHVCRLSLDEAVRREAESWRHRAASPAPEDHGRFVLPVAVRSLIRILEIRSVGRGVAETLFEWQWRPNQAGLRLGVSTAPRAGMAQLVLDDGGWRAVRVDPGPN